MMAKIDVREIIRDYLVRNGYDGLFTPDDDCGCDVDALAPCGEPYFDCAAGYRHSDGGIWPAREGVDDE